MIVKAALLLVAVSFSDGSSTMASRLLVGESCDSNNALSLEQSSKNYFKEGKEKGYVVDYKHRCMNITINVEGGDPV